LTVKDYESNSKSEVPSNRAAPNRIAAAIDEFVHRVLDIKDAARLFVPAAARLQAEALHSILAEMKRNIEQLESSDGQSRLLGSKAISELTPKVNRIVRSNLAGAVETGLFLSLFSSYDAFTGDLIRALFDHRPELFSKLNGTVSFGDVLTATSLDTLKSQVLDEEIETLRRKSYVEQFTALSQRFDIKLTAFTRWPDFVEAGQRRNLITHCDGIVSDQYLQVCKEQGVTPDKLPVIGETVRLTPNYMLRTCDLLNEVGVKLGHTLWRKAIPAELEFADDHLDSLLYSELRKESYGRAKMFGEFALSLPRLSSDMVRKRIIVNYAQALKRSNESNKMHKLLASVDWSAAFLDFRLAHYVLTDDFQKAAELMLEIGPKGAMITETTYHAWPLFLEFRQSEQFAAAYSALYGYPFLTKLKEEATAVSTSAEKVDRANSTCAGASLQSEQKQKCPEALARP
jgi:hypothetical protein